MKSSSDTVLVAPGLTTRNKKLLETKGIATRSKDATNVAPRPPWSRLPPSLKRL